MNITDLQSVNVGRTHNPEVLNSKEDQMINLYESNLQFCIIWVKFEEGHEGVRE